PLAVLGLVIEGAAAALDLDLAGREVALVVGHVVVGVPEAPLDEREDLQVLGRRGGVLDPQLVNLGGVPLGDEHEQRRADALPLAGDAGVTQAMTALEAVERRL